MERVPGGRLKANVRLTSGTRAMMEDPGTVSRRPHKLTFPERWKHAFLKYAEVGEHTV